MTKEGIIRYYDYTIPFWNVFWHKGTNAIHYGFWDENTKNLQEALMNTNKVVARIAHIDSSKKVLDAGCGIGGSSIWLAREFGCSVVGVTLSSKQKDKAEEHAREDGIQDEVKFYVMDYAHTDFPDASFDVVWALESVCYEQDKNLFIREAYRVLKPNGTIVVADGFLRRAPENEKEKRDYQDFLKGFVLDNLASVDDFRRGLENAGFKNIEYFDKTTAIQKTAQQMYEMCVRWYWFAKFTRMLHLIPQLMVDNIRTGIAQRDFFKGPGGYGIFYAEK